MGKLFVLMGKSASGKDTLMAQLLAECPHIKKMASYTTRPMEDGEENGREYCFVTKEFINQKELDGLLIEKRTYQTETDQYIYATIDDGFDFSQGSYIAIKDPAGTEALKKRFGREKVVTVLVEVNDGVRLMRALTREFSQENPRFAEICRRYLSDETEFKGVVPDFTVNNDNVIKATSVLRNIIRENRK